MKLLKIHILFVLISTNYNCEVLSENIFYQSLNHLNDNKYKYLCVCLLLKIIHIKINFDENLKNRTKESNQALLNLIHERCLAISDTGPEIEHFGIELDDETINHSGTKYRYIKKKK